MVEPSWSSLSPRFSGFLSGSSIFFPRRGKLTFLKIAGLHLLREPPSPLGQASYTVNNILGIDAPSFFTASLSGAVENVPQLSSIPALVYEIDAIARRIYQVDDRGATADGSVCCAGSPARGDHRQPGALPSPTSQWSAAGRFGCHCDSHRASEQAIGVALCLPCSPVLKRLNGCRPASNRSLSAPRCHVECVVETLGRRCTSSSS